MWPFGPLVWADQKNKKAALASDWLRHFQLLLWNRWMEFNETLQQDLNILYQACVFLGRSEKTRWPVWPLIDWDIFDFSSKTTERNSTKLDRKQDLNILFWVCVFGADQWTKMSALADSSKRWHIVLRCTICGPLGLLLRNRLEIWYMILFWHYTDQVRVCHVWPSFTGVIALGQNLVFRTFLCCLLRYWFMNLSWHNTDQVWFRHTSLTLTGVITLC